MKVIRLLHGVNRINDGSRVREDMDPNARAAGRLCVVLSAKTGYFSSVELGPPKRRHMGRNDA